MKQLLAALVFFVVAGPSFAGDVGIDRQIEFGAGLKGAFDGGALTKLNVAPHSIATWSNPSWSDAVHNQPGEGLSFGFDTFDLKPKVTKFHLGFDTPDHCPTCIIFPLDPLPKDAPIKLPPDTLAHLQPGVNAQSVFREAAAWGGDDSEVLGCNIATSSFLKTLSHKRPEFSWRQFPEVVKLSITRPGTLGVEGCTGTIVAANWVLTAAHCITGKSSAALANNDANQPEEQDFVFSPPTNDQALQINAMNSALVDVDKVRYGDKAIVNKLYDAEPSSNSHDVALVHVAQPFNPGDFPEASLADAFTSLATLAGYGVSNTAAPLGEFFVTFPPSLAEEGEHFTFVPGEKKGAFCQGDSGGPVFVGLNRGCKPGDTFAEKRPRAVQGVISFNIEGVEKSMAATCMAASKMASQSVTLTEIHDWICRTSNNEINGCGSQPTAGKSK